MLAKKTTEQLSVHNEQLLQDLNQLLAREAEMALILRERDHHIERINERESQL